ncbi:MAG: peptidylprolyl isomerase [Clostridiales bacterium]|nr:peptidylprolyl isomerase [Clostridiales bacterium]
MKRIRKYITMALAGVMILTFSGCSLVERTPESIGKTVLAKVGKEKITRADVDKIMYYQLQQYKSQYGDDFENDDSIKDTLKQARTSALNSLVEEKVLFAKQEEIGAEFTDDEIQTEVDSRVQMYKDYTGSDDAYAKFLEQYGYTEDEFKDYWTTQIKLEKIVDKMLEDIEVTDEEAQEYYNENTDNYKLEPGANVTHILFSDADKGEEQAKAARELAVQGKTFDEIAAMDEYKDVSKAEDLGYQASENNSQLVTEFVDGFKNLKEGEISQPVKTSFGWHLIKVTNVSTEEKTQTFDEVKETVKSTVLNNKKSEAYTERIEKYKNESDVKIYEDRI